MDDEQPNIPDLAVLRDEVARIAKAMDSLESRISSLEGKITSREPAIVPSTPSRQDLARIQEPARPAAEHQQELGPSPPPLPGAMANPPRTRIAESAAGRRDDNAVELAIGGRLLTWLGGFLLILAVGFAVQWWWRTFRVPVWVQVTGTHLLALGILAAGLFVKKRLRLPILSQGLFGVGVFSLYAAALAALRIYKVWPESVAFAEFAGITAFAVLLAVYADNVGVILLGALGGYLAPFLTAGDKGNHVTLFVYLAFLNIALLAAAIGKRWHIVKPITLVATGIMFLAWLGNGYRWEHRWSTEWLLVLHAAIQGAAVLGPALLLSRRTVLADHLAASGAALGFFALNWLLFHEVPGHRLALLSWSLAGLHFVLFGLAYLRIGNEDRLPRVLLGLGTVFLTLALPIQLQDWSWLGIAWCIEGAVFTAIAVYFCDPQLRISGLVMLAMGALRLWGVDYAEFDFSQRQAWYHNHILFLLSSAGVLYLFAGAMESFLPRRTIPSSLDRNLGGISSNLLLALGNVMVLLALTTQWRNRGILAVWTFDVALLWAAAFAFDLFKTRCYAFAIAMLLVNGLALYVGLDRSPDAITVWNARCLSLSLVAIVYLLAGIAYWKLVASVPKNPSRSLAEPLTPQEAEPNLQFIVGLLGHAILVVAITLEIRDWFHPPGYSFPVDVSQLPKAELATYSIAWAVYSALAIAAGFAIRYPFYRWLGLAGFVVVLAKVFLVDLANIELLPRVLAFAVLGTALMATSLLYQRYAARLATNAKPTAGTT